VRVDLFDFDLPTDRIALRPARPRDSARLLLVEGRDISDRQVLELPQLLRGGDTLVFNDTKVIPAQLEGRRGEASIGATLHKREGPREWQAFLRNAKRARVGEAIDFGEGFAAAAMFGSQHNDPLENKEGSTVTNHAGGIVGGITNSNELVFRIAIKPTASTPKQQNSLNWETGKMEDFSIKGRHDLCVALRAPVILEAATAVALVDLMMLEQRIPRIWK